MEMDSSTEATTTSCATSVTQSPLQNQQRLPVHHQIVWLFLPQKQHHLLPHHQRPSWLRKMYKTEPLLPSLVAAQCLSWPRKRAVHSGNQNWKGSQDTTATRVYNVVRLTQQRISLRWPRAIEGWAIPSSLNRSREQTTKKERKRYCSYKHCQMTACVLWKWEN